MSLFAKGEYYIMKNPKGDILLINKRINCHQINYKANKEYKEMKVYDAWYMSEDVKEIIFEYSRGISNDVFIKRGTSNNVFIKWCVYEGKGRFENEISENDDIIFKDKNNIYHVRGDNPIDDWLYENGANPYEDVIIEYYPDEEYSW